MNSNQSHDEDKEDENLVEIEIEENDDDLLDMEEEDATVWTETENEIDLENEPSILDNAYCTFTSHHGQAVYCVAIHPVSHNLIMTGGGDDKAYFWKYDATQSFENNSDKLLYTKELLGHTDTVTSVGFNFDGQLGLSGSYDGTVRIWNVESGESTITLEGPEDVEWAQWHMRGNAVIAGSRDGTLWMWLSHNGQCVHVFSGHEGGVNVGGFSSDGKLICSGGEDGTVRVWVPKSGACKHVFDTTHGGHSSLVTCLSSSDDGDLILSGSTEGTIKLYQISGKRLLQTFIHSVPGQSPPNGLGGELTRIAEESEGNEGQEESEVNQDVSAVECVGFCHSPSYRWIASGGMDQTLKIWDMNTTASTPRCVCLHNGSVVALQWHQSIDLPFVVTVALDTLIRVWDARSGLMLVQLSGHQDMITNFASGKVNYPMDDTANSISEPQSNEESIVTDSIITVSDDGTAKVFLLNFRNLLS